MISNSSEDDEENRDTIRDSEEIKMNAIGSDFSPISQGNF